MRYNVLKFWDKFGKNCRVFLTSGMKRSLHTLAKNLLILFPAPGKMFNMFNMHIMLFLALKKVPIVRNTPCQIPNTQQKYAPSKISHCFNWRDAPTPYCHFKSFELPTCTKRGFFGKTDEH